MLTNNITVPGYVPRRAEGDGISFCFVSPHYFETLGQALRSCRDFDDRDQQNSARVAIVNQAFADRYLNGRDLLGLRFSHSQTRIELTIVGIVGDARYDIRSRPIETVFRTNGPTLLRQRGDEQSLAGSERIDDGLIGDAALRTAPPARCLPGIAARVRR
jgi:hypothetical protein